MESRRELRWRNDTKHSGRQFAEGSACIRYSDGKICLGTARVRRRRVLGWSLGTAGGLIFFCDDDGSLAAADARTGKRLWSFQASRLWKASPMTYRFDGQQYVAVATGQSVISFGLPANH